MCKHSIYEITAFKDRVDFAARTISAGRSTTRAFDTCFEMSDGSAVALALYRRTVNRPDTKLAANLWRYISLSATERDIIEYNYTPELNLEALSASLCLPAAREPAT